MIGPRALDDLPVIQYVVPPGRVGGPGIPKWRGLAVFLGVLVLVANLPKGGPDSANADSFGGDSVSCTTQAFTAATFSPLGYAAATIQFHLTMPAGGTVGGRWVSSQGYMGGLDNWSGGLADPVDLWLGQGSNGQDVNGDGVIDGTITNYYMDINFSQTAGTISYVVQKLASYGGCFSVDHVVVTRTPRTGPAPNTPNPSAPGASQSIAPTPSGGAPSWAPGSPVPSGWCAVYDERAGVSEGVLVPCVTPPAASVPPSGTTHSCRVSWPTTTCTSELGWSVPGATVSGDVAIDDSHAHSEGYGAPSGFNSWTAYDQRAPAHEDGSANGSYASFDSVSYPTHSDTWSYGPIETVNSTFLGYALVDWCNGCGAYSATSDSYIDFTWTVNVDDPSASPSPSPSSSGNPMPSGWPSYPPLPTFGAFPSFAWPSLPPFSWPSYPPFPSSGVNICAPNASGATPAIAACVSASGEPGASFDYGQPDASAAISGFEALASALAMKAPFGAVAQVSEALSAVAESPEGPSFTWCYDVPVMENTVHWCIPTEPIEQLGSVRWLLVIVVWIATALVLLRIAVGAVGARTGEASE